MTDRAGGGALPVICRLLRNVSHGLTSVVCRPLQWPVQHAGTKLDDGDDVEQQHKRPECKRDGDRPRAAAAPLLIREYDALLAVVIVHAGALLLTAGRGRVRPAGHRSKAPQITRTGTGSKRRTTVSRPVGPRLRRPEP